jgi:hypothetical protein
MNFKSYKLRETKEKTVFMKIFYYSKEEDSENK